MSSESVDIVCEKCGNRGLTIRRNCDLAGHETARWFQCPACDHVLTWRGALKAFKPQSAVIEPTPAPGAASGAPITIIWPKLPDAEAGGVTPPPEPKAETWRDRPPLF